MFRRRIIERPVVPESCLTPLSAIRNRESIRGIGTVPVCISMEEVSMHIKDFVKDADMLIATMRRFERV